MGNTLAARPADPPSVQAETAAAASGSAAASAAATAAATASPVRLLLLGVAQDAGVPQAGCSCANCEAAWAGDMPRQLVVSAALIDERAGKYFYLDCSPDFKDQHRAVQEHFAERGLSGMELGGVLLTHLHSGHYTGLFHFGREAMDYRGLKVWATDSAAAFFRGNEPWRFYCAAGNFELQRIEPGRRLQLTPSLAVTPAAVPHRAEFSDAVGFYVEGPSRRAFYLPDIDSWQKWLEAGVDVRDVVSSVDLAFLDGCFFDASELPGRDIREIPHPLVTDTAARLEGLLAATEVAVVHLNHSNPLWRTGSQQRRWCEARGLRVGEQGAEYAL